MDIREALYTTRAMRRVKSDPIPMDVQARIMDAAVLMVYESRVRPEQCRFAPWVDGQWTKIDRALDTLEQRWLSHLHGPLDMGQIAVGVALGYLDFRHGDRGWRGGRPGLAAWDAVFAERPSMVATRPAG